MRLKFMGYVHSKGDFVNEQTGEVIVFDSVTADCLSDKSVSGQNVISQGGQHYRKVKFKSVDIPAIFGKGFESPSDLNKLIGKTVIVDGVMRTTKSGQYVSPEEITIEGHL